MDRTIHNFNEQSEGAANVIRVGHGPHAICVEWDAVFRTTDEAAERALAALADGSLWRRSFSFAFGVPASPTVDPATRVGVPRPFNEPFLAFLRSQRKAGRTLVLISPGGGGTTQQNADLLDIFEEVIELENVEGSDDYAVSQRLVKRFGYKGFDYACSRFAPNTIAEADGVLLVCANSTDADRARSVGKVIAQFEDTTSRLRETLRAMRPHQWVKNLLVFIPLLASRSLVPSEILATAVAFVGFCLTASAVYLINDLLDIAADREHPRKRFRPFARGTLSPRWGIGVAVALLACGVMLGATVNTGLLLVTYAVVSSAYSLTLKTYPLVDVFLLAALYTLRIVTGGIASGHLVTLWLLAFSGFAFLSLGFVKRYGEVASSSSSKLARRGYSANDCPMLMMFGVSAAFASSIVLTLFINASAALQPYKLPDLLWWLVPLILFWQLRMWLSAFRGYMHDDPIVYAAKDWVSWLVATGVVIVVIGASVNAKLW